MTCRKTRKWLSLMVGDDLPAKKAAAVRAHCEKCARCRKEAEGLALAIRAAKKLALSEEKVGLNAAEWKKMIRAATAERVEELKARPLGLQPALAVVLAAIFVAGLTFVLFQRPLEKTNLRAALMSPGTIQQLTGTRPEAGKAQDVLKMTIVSQETGLRITWFFDKNFDWEGLGK
jgi:anti-sigma factor RsiW